VGINVTQRRLESEWNGTYWRPTLPVRILGPFRCLAMAVGDNDRGFHNVVPGAGNDGVAVRGVMADSWSG